jgi:hypothetical protein
MIDVGRAFDDAIVGLLSIGIAIGVVLVGVAYGLYWVASHLTIGWR